MFSFITIVAAMLLYGLVHSWLASQPAKTLAQRCLGRGFHTYRLLYNLMSILSFLPVLALVVVLDDHPLYALAFPWWVLAVIGQVAAALVLLVGVKQTGMAAFLGWTDLLNPRAQEDIPLTTTGLYRWVRHPLYSAGLVFIWLTPVMTFNRLALYLGATLYILIGVYFEERKLLRQFGQAYREYQARTPMLIPFL